MTAPHLREFLPGLDGEQFDVTSYNGPSDPRGPVKRQSLLSMIFNRYLYELTAVTIIAAVLASVAAIIISIIHAR